MASIIYNSYKGDALDGAVDLANDTIKMALVTSTYTPDIDADEFFDDITNEVVGTGYVAGGGTLTGTTVTVDDTNDKGVFDAADETWATSTITARGAVVYKDTGVSSTSPLICYLDFTEDKTSTGGDFTVAFNASGIINLN